MMEQANRLRGKLEDKLARMDVSDLNAMQRLLNYSLESNGTTVKAPSWNTFQSQTEDGSSNTTSSLGVRKGVKDLISVPIIEYYHQLLTSSQKPSDIVLHDLSTLCPPLSSAEIEAADYLDGGDQERRDTLVSRRYEMTLSLLLYQRALLSHTYLTSEIFEDLASGCALHESFCGHQSMWFIHAIKRLKLYVPEATLVLTAMGQEEENSGDEDMTKPFMDSVQMPIRMEQDDERNKENVMPKLQRRALPEIEFKKQRNRKKEKGSERPSNISAAPPITRLVAKESPTKRTGQDTRRILATPPRRKLRL